MDAIGGFGGTDREGEKIFQYSLQFQIFSVKKTNKDFFNCSNENQWFIFAYDQSIKNTPAIELCNQPVQNMVTVFSAEIPRSSIGFLIFLLI